jgi:hypothetical protein
MYALDLSVTGSERDSSCSGKHNTNIRGTGLYFVHL